MTDLEKCAIVIALSELEDLAPLPNRGTYVGYMAYTAMRRAKYVLDVEASREAWSRETMLSAERILTSLAASLRDYKGILAERQK